MNSPQCNVISTLPVLLTLLVNFTSRFLTSKIQNPLAINFSFDRFLQKKKFILSFLELLFIILFHEYHHLPLYFTATSLELRNSCLLLIQYVSGTHKFMLRGNVKPVKFISTSFGVFQLQLSPEALTSFTSSWAADIRVGYVNCRETRSGGGGEQQSISS